MIIFNRVIKLSKGLHGLNWLRITIYYIFLISQTLEIPLGCLWCYADEGRWLPLDWTPVHCRLTPIVTCYLEWDNADKVHCLRTYYSVQHLTVNSGARTSNLSITNDTEPCVTFHSISHWCSSRWFAILSSFCVDEKNWQSDFPYKRHYAYQESKKRWTQFLYLQVTWQCLIAEKLCHLVISFKICSTFLNISPIILFFLLTCKLTFEQINKSLHTDHFNCWAVRNNKTCLLPLG